MDAEEVDGTGATGVAARLPIRGREVLPPPEGSMPPSRNGGLNSRAEEIRYKCTFSSVGRHAELHLTNQDEYPIHIGLLHARFTWNYDHPSTSKTAIAHIAPPQRDRNVDERRKTRIQPGFPKQAHDPATLAVALSSNVDKEAHLIIP